MGTEVLRPQDCLIHQRIRVSPAVFPRRKSNYYGNGQSRPNVNGSRKVQVRPEQQQQRRRSPEPAPGPKRSASVGDLKVTILRRGETIDWKENSTPATTSFSGTSEMVPKQIRLSRPATDVYAGSATCLSPSPRAVPLPSFFNRKSPNTTVDDSATKDLRRLLRLE